jgi:hypothetical protein
VAAVLVTSKKKAIVVPGSTPPRYQELVPLNVAIRVWVIRGAIISTNLCEVVIDTNPESDKHNDDIDIDDYLNKLS